MMQRIIKLVACCLLVTAFSVQAQVPQVLGLWELNVAASSLPERLFPNGLASERRSYFQRDDGYLVVLDIREYGNGMPDFIQVVAKSDGQDYPQYQSAPLTDLVMAGTTTPFTYSETIVGPNTAEITAKRAGQIANKGARTISADGKTMTLNVAAVLSGGEEVPILLVFDKQ
jgi:hypothetical protein